MGELTEFTPRYDAFISYRHKELDVAVAKAIHKQLETYRIPSYIKRKTGKARMGKVFRDQDELPLLADLGEGIRRALEESRWLIVICSPDLPLSKWCLAEIDYFIELGRRDRILTVLIAGEPEESFPAQLRFLDGVEREPLAADVRADSLGDTLKKVRREKLRLLAPMLGVGYDDLRRRQRERLMKTVVSVSAAAVFAMASATTYVLRQNALLDEQKTIAQGQRDEALRSQSRFLAELSTQQLQKGDRMTATLLALEALPADLESPDRPLVPEAVAALRNAEVVAGSSGFVPLAVLEHSAPVISSMVHLMHSGTMLTATRDGSVYGWDLNTGELVGARPGDGSKGTVRAVYFDDVTYDITVLYDEHYETTTLESYPEAVRSQPFFQAKNEEKGEYFIGYYYTTITQNSFATILSCPAKKAELWRQGKCVYLEPAEEVLSFRSVDMAQGSRAEAYLFAAGLAGYSDDSASTIVIWDGVTGERLREMPIQTEVNLVRFAPNRASLLSISGGVVQLWNVHNATLIHTLNTEDVKRDRNFALDAAFSKDSQTLAVLMESGMVRLYDVTTGRWLRDLQNDGRKLLSIEWSADGSQLLCACDDNAARLFDAATGERALTLQSYAQVEKASFYNSLTIGLSLSDNAIHIFTRQDEPSYATAKTLIGDSMIWGYDWSPDGKHIVSCTRGGTLNLFDAESGELLRSDTYSYLTGAANFDTMRWTPDGQRLLLSNRTGISLWDPFTGESLVEAEWPEDEAYSPNRPTMGKADLNADATRMVGALQYKDRVRVFDAETGALLVEFSHNPDNPSDAAGCKLACSPTDPDRVMTWYEYRDNPELKLWDLSGNLIFQIPGEYRIVHAAYSPDGQYIAVHRAGEGLHVLNAADGTPAAFLENKHLQAGRGLCWSPDGALLALYSDYNGVWVWDWQGDGVVAQFKDTQAYEPISNVFQFSWSPDSAMLTVGPTVYAVGDGTEIMTLPDGFSHLNSYRWSPDSASVLTSHNAFTVRIWSLGPVEQVVADARARVGERVLTDGEREKFHVQ